MRSWWLAIKIAAVFLVVLLAFVSLTLHLFARMVMHSGGHDIHRAHDAFMLTVLWLGAGAMIVMVGLAVYVTAPLRRMSRSMDRIAAGDLDHRVVVHGNDEGAAIGRSFNAMADRVRDMVVGQRELMAGVSHELRSPLARMKISLELLREGRGGADRIAGLEADVDALDALVEELLLASRIDLGAVSLTPEPLDLAELCREAWTRVAAEAATRGTTLALDLGADATHVAADRALALRLLGNLFENAVRHGGPGEVRISSERHHDRVRITVADQGPGVAEADLARLFEPFFRADRSRSRRTGAGGLGLMIVRRAVEAHGGSVQARRADPRGLAVTFDLPAGVRG